MNKHAAERYIIHALEYLDKYTKSKEEKVSLTLKGKAASFGPSVISIGMLPTAAFYSAEDASKTEHREVISAIWAILCNDSNLHAAGCKNLCDYIINGADDPALKRDRILAASTAYKIALRTYPEEEAKK